MDIKNTQYSVKRVSIIAFSSVACLIVICCFLVISNLRQQANMLESSSISYELRIVLDRSNEQLNLLFEPGSVANFSDRILQNIRKDFLNTTEEFSTFTGQLQALLVDQSTSFGSLIPTAKHHKIVAEIQNINAIWQQYQKRIDEVAGYSLNTLRAGNKLWQPLDATVAHNSSLATSISALNQLVYQSSLEQNHRLVWVYIVMLVLMLGTVWGIWLFTLNPLAERLKCSYRQIIEKNRRLDYQANHDALTGLLNRAAFNKKITALESASSETDPYCLVMIDLDNFKIINDTLGHNVGDLVLQRIAADVSDLPIKGKHAYRLGGDEFALLIECHGAESDLILRLKQLLVSVRKPIVYQGNEVQTSCSIGAAIAGESCGFDQSDVFAAADAALYQVKTRGRDGLQLYSCSIPSVRLGSC